jgi:hypothetical protein
MRNPFLRIAALAAFACLACDNGARVAGGGSDIGNGNAIAGTALRGDGSPAAGLTARLRPAGYLAALPVGAPKAAAANDSIADARLDDQGRFAFPGIKPGDYRIEILDSSASQGVLVDCHRDSAGAELRLAPARLAATGALRVLPPYGAGVEAVGYVRIKGIERIARLHSGSDLIIPGLAAGAYEVVTASRDSAMATVNGRVDLPAGDSALLMSPTRGCGDRVCDSLALSAFFRDNGIQEPIGRFIASSQPSRITELILNGFASGYHFKTMAGLERLTAMKVFKVEGPFLADSNMAPLFDALAGMDSLWLLSLCWSKDSGFTAIPPGIGKLRNVRQLFLLGDSLKALPAEIGDMHKLEFISLQFNQIRELPAWSDFPVLYELQVPHNELRALPAAMFSWPALNKIDIADNHLCSLDSAQRAWVEARNGYGGPEGQRCP